MPKDTSLKIKIEGDSKSFDKAMENTVKKLEHTRRKAKETKKDVSGMGDGFTKAANNVAIFNGQLDPIAGRLSAIGSGITRFGVANIALGTAVAAVGIGIGKSVSALENYEQRQNRFNSVLRSTGFAARLTRKDLEELAQSTARNTLGGVDEIAEGVVALTTFRNIQGEIFKDTIRLAADAKVAFGGNLREGVVAFGKALNDPAANLGALSRKGIQFTDEQSDMIKRLQETGELLKAQTIITQELKDQFGGLAVDEAPALAAAMDSLGQSVQNMWEGLGRTEGGTFIRDVFVQMAKGADRAAQKIADLHTEEKVELATINELKDKQLRLHETLTYYQIQYNQALKDGVVTAEDGIPISITRTKKLYDETTDALYRFIAVKKLNRIEDNIIAEKGLAKTLAGELSAVEAQTKNLEKAMNTRRVSLISGFETEENKALRVFAEKSKAYAESYTDQLSTSKKAEEKQIKVIEQGVEVRKAIYAKDEMSISYRYDKKRKGIEDITKLMELDNQQADEIAKKRNIMDAKNAAARDEIDKVKLENAIKNVELELKVATDNANAKNGLNLKLAAIEAKDEARAKAKTKAERRAIEVARSAHRKRMKFLDEISAGSSKLKQLEYAYNDDLDKLKSAEFQKLAWSEYSVDERVKLAAKYAALLKVNYDTDVDNFTKAEESKTAAKLAQAGRDSVGSYKQDLELNLSGLDKKDTGVESFFDVDILKYQEELDAMAEVYKLHQDKIRAMKIDDDEKDRRLTEVRTEFKTKKAETEAAAKVAVEGDMWNALNQLSAGSSKKAFALAKAMNMSKTIMNTSQAVSNALANIPAPFNIPAAGLVGAAGLVELSRIKREKMPQFHDGIDYVEREGTYLLDRGERVVDSRLNADLKSYLKDDGNGSKGDSNITFSVQAGDVNGFDNWYANNRQSIINDIKYGMDS